MYARKPRQAHFTASHRSNSCSSSSCHFTANLLKAAAHWTKSSALFLAKRRGSLHTCCSVAVNRFEKFVEGFHPVDGESFHLVLVSSAVRINVSMILAPQP